MKRHRFTPGFFMGFVFLSFSLAGPPSGYGTGLERAFQLTYEVHLEAIPADAEGMKVWIPLAASNGRQKIRRRVIQTAVPYRVTRDEEYGNDILYLDLRRPLPQTLDVSIRYEANVQGERVEALRTISEFSSLGRKKDLYLRPTRYMAIDDKVRALAENITADAATPGEKAQRIYRYVIERMTYEKETPGWGKGDTLRACEVGTGNCTDFHSLFISLARACGIPAQFQIGLSVPQKQEGEIPGYHCWAQFYLDGVGWVPVDASEAWKDRSKTDYFFGTYDPNRLAVSSGRDIRLVPKPASGPENIFFFPHVEVDGKQVEKERVKTKFSFQGVARKGKDGNHA